MVDKIEDWNNKKNEIEKNLRPLVDNMFKSLPNIVEALDDGKEYIRKNNKKIYIEYLKLEAEQGADSFGSFEAAMANLSLQERDFMDYATVVTKLVKTLNGKLDSLKKVTKNDEDLYGNLLFMIDECMRNREQNVAPLPFGHKYYFYGNPQPRTD